MKEMKFNFKNKNVFISGGTHGIGLSCAELFSSFGANIITFSRDKKKIQITKKKLKKYKNKVHVMKGDILDKKSINQILVETINKFKNIDILIHNVGGGGRWGKEDILNTDDDVWDDVYNKNNFGIRIFNKAFLPNMMKKKWGRVIAISSICGTEVKEHDRVWFNAAKSSEIAIMKSFSKKKVFTKKNITFNSISPGPILIKNTGWDDLKKKNPMKFKKFYEKEIPTKHIGISEDIANLVAFISSDYAKFVNGSNLIVDGGISNRI